MTIGAILLLIGFTCVIINLGYIFNSKWFANKSSDDQFAIFAGCVIIAPFWTLLSMIYFLGTYMNKVKDATPDAKPAKGTKG